MQDSCPCATHISSGFPDRRARRAVDAPCDRVAAAAPESRELQQNKRPRQRRAAETPMAETRDSRDTERLAMSIAVGVSVGFPGLLTTTARVALCPPKVVQWEMRTDRNSPCLLSGLRVCCQPLQLLLRELGHRLELE